MEDGPWDEDIEEGFGAYGPCVASNMSGMLFLLPLLDALVGNL